jgi:very-short-patch-repair endonuclease
MFTKTQPALVGVVPRKKLWSIIQQKKWYHIPVESAPNNTLLVEYLAFYFPKCFGEELQYKIKYYSKITAIDIVKRVKLFPDEPRHKNANKDYYQLHLEKIKELPNPISSKEWRRIIHIPTSKQKLFSAKEINDLWDTSPLEEKIYQALKKQKIATERQVYVEVGGNKYYLDFGIFCHKGKIDIECDGEKYHILPEALTKDRQRNNQLTSFGWQVLRFSGREIIHDIKKCIDIISKTIYNSGGLKNY